MHAAAAVWKQSLSLLCRPIQRQQCCSCPHYDLIIREKLNFFRACESLLFSFNRTVYRRRFLNIERLGKETHGRATDRHMPYGITQCYLPPDTGEHIPP